MSHILRTLYDELEGIIEREEMEKIMKQRRWRTVDVAISDKDLRKYFPFLNDGVVMRCSRENVPLMTTTGIFGPIMPKTKVMLTPGKGTGIKIIKEFHDGMTLIDELELRYDTAKEPKPHLCKTVSAKWVSADDGGAIPSLNGSANVFGATGSLLINESMVDLPVLDIQHKHYHETLAYYGGKLLAPGETFSMGFDKPLFGMQYDTRLPDYIRSYAMEPFGGGGLFVEHHPFPHIFLPKPTANGEVFCESRIILGRKSEDYTTKEPKYTFSVFRVPNDGSALTIRPNTIHNDSYTDGKQTVFLANTPANTVAWRETQPYTSINLNDAKHE